MANSLSLRRISSMSNNGWDRLFKAKTMVRAGLQPFEVVHERGIHQVRHYLPLTEDEIVVGESVVPVSKTRNPIPLVLVAPLAVNMYVYDLLPERSLVRYLMAQGFDVYLVDWGCPTRKQAGLTLNDYIADFLPDCLKAVREHSGSRKLNLQGWSMGGGMVLAYTALFKDTDIHSIVTYGTPIDGHANGAIGKQYQKLAHVLKTARLNFRKVPAKLLYTPGWANVIGFKLLDPVGSLKGYWSLFTQLDNRDYVAQHANQAAFIDSLEAYPGGALRDWFCSIWLENETARGQFKVGKQVAYFADIQCPVLGVAGKSDNLANVSCCKAIVNVVGSDAKEFFIGPGGHIAIMSGKDAPHTIWAKTVSWINAQS
ncbi:alpha/beta fold hydrolase [Limnobacter humi]|uniref:Alpha/beta fold hydrolase n=1 Tax=Limnobacter humi TaxID=1778671 RepID=A0ABT1WGP8_9BURK|nr:alpha/beta fold hydrolase [Limnobacter humi]MCQ8896703.1 alpha/beta fold hydrolase [Limnobacter humi]